MTTPQAPPLDWVMVPREPTEAMKIAAFGPVRGGGRHGPVTSDFLRQAAALSTYRAMIAAAPTPQAPDAGLRRALKAAEQFIANGIELGFIRLPKYTDDPAHNTLPLIREALSAVPTVDVGGGGNSSSGGKLPSSQGGSDPIGLAPLEGANYPAINLQYRLDMAAAAFRAILHSGDPAELEAFAKAGLDYAAGDQEALAEGAAWAVKP